MFDEFSTLKSRTIVEHIYEGERLKITFEDGSYLWIGVGYKEDDSPCLCALLLDKNDEPKKSSINKLK